MVTNNQVLSLRNLLEFPVPLFDAIDRLFPGVPAETRQRARHSRELREATMTIRDVVINTPRGEDTEVLDFAFSDESEMQQWVMYCFAEFAKANPLDVWKSLKQEDVIKVYANVFGLLMVHARNEIEKAWIEDELTEVKESYERFLQAHPSFDDHHEPEIRIVHKRDEVFGAVGDLLEALRRASSGQRDGEMPEGLAHMFAGAGRMDR